MDLFLNLTASGFVMGCLYGLLAIAFAVIYRTTGIVNFAQGEMSMLVAYLAYTCGDLVDYSLIPLFLITVVASVFVGLVLERLFIRPMLGQSTLATVMVTVGLAISLRSITIIIWGVDQEDFPAPMKNEIVEIGSVILFSEQLAAIAIFLAVLVSIWAFFKFTRTGTSMRAVAVDETAALLMGINVKHVYSISWAISAVISGLAGVLFAIIFARTPDMWFIGLQSFPATILGGLESPLGSGLGGIIIGVIADLSEGYIGQGLKEIAGFIIIIFVLMVRPYGLFGQRELERV
jgi:branched-chain amino acid transport system permease protein